MSACGGNVGWGGTYLHHQSLPILCCPWSDSASVEEPGGCGTPELACALTGAFWTLAGAAGPGPSNWKDLRGEGRCRPAPALLHILGLSQSCWKPLSSGNPPIQTYI